MTTQKAWQDIGFVIASEHRKKILNLLSITENTPKGISKSFNININHVSACLKSLLKKELVECITPKNKKGRIYRITEKGLNVLNIIKKIENF